MMFPLPVTTHLTATFRASYKNELRKALFATHNRFSLRFRNKTCFPGSLPFHFRLSREGGPVVNLSQQMKVFQPTGIHAGKPYVEDFHHRDTKLRTGLLRIDKLMFFPLLTRIRMLLPTFLFLIPG
jgi:hypothetical protein